MENNEIIELRKKIKLLEIENEKLNEETSTLFENLLLFYKIIDIPELMFLHLDKNGNIAMINNNLSEFLGYSENELSDKNWFETCVPEKIKNDIQKVFKRLLNGDIDFASYFENPVLKKNGEEAVIAWNNGLLYDSEGKISGILCSGKDITERLVYEKKLKDSNNIINSSQSVTFLWKNEKNWPVEFVSENVSELFGYSSEEFISGSVLYSEIIHSEDIKRVENEVEYFSSSGDHTRFVHKPYRIVSKNGDIKWIDDRSFIKRDENGKITHYQGIILDITKRIQYETQLINEKNELENALKQLKTLRGLLPICSYCKNIRDDKGYWKKLEEYIGENSEAEFSHGICPDCLKIHFSQFDLNNK